MVVYRFVRSLKQRIVGFEIRNLCVKFLERKHYEETCKTLQTRKIPNKHRARMVTTARLQYERFSMNDVNINPFQIYT